MGRYLNVIANLVLTGGAAVFIMCATTGFSAQAKARIPAAQAYPALSLTTPLARDAETFETDKSLNAECRKTGQKNTVCLCVTHIMKYELTLSEYRAATRLYGRSSDRKTLHETLKNEGFKSTEIGMAEDMERSLIEDDNFALRCSEAKAYYKTPNE